VLLQAASAGHVQAQYNVAMMHLAGKGTQRACKPALTHLKALVEKGPQAGALQAAHEAFFKGHHNQVNWAGWVLCEGRAHPSLYCMYQQEQSHFQMDSTAGQQWQL
jgi:TPR repeat protein